MKARTWRSGLEDFITKLQTMKESHSQISFSFFAFCNMSWRIVGSDSSAFVITLYILQSACCGLQKCVAAKEEKV